MPSLAPSFHLSSCLSSCLCPTLYSSCYLFRGELSCSFSLLLVLFIWFHSPKFYLSLSLSFFLVKSCSWVVVTLFLLSHSSFWSPHGLSLLLLAFCLTKRCVFRKRVEGIMIIVSDHHPLSCRLRREWKWMYPSSFSSCPVSCFLWFFISYFLSSHVNPIHSVCGDKNLSAICLQFSCSVVSLHDPFTILVSSPRFLTLLSITTTTWREWQRICLFHFPSIQKSFTVSFPSSTLLFPVFLSLSVASTLNPGLFPVLYNLHWYPQKSCSLCLALLLSCLFQQRLWYFSEKRDASVWVMAFHGRKILSFKSFSVFFERKIKSLTLVFSILSFLHCVKKNNISCYTAFNIKWRKTVPVILYFLTISVAFLKTQKSDFAHLQYLFFDFLTEVCFKIGRTKDARDKLM